MRKPVQLVFLALLPFVIARDYCSICQDHTMCRFTGKNPTSGEKAENSITPLEAQQIVDMHNAYRTKVAKGRESRGRPGPQPPAANMHALVWDDKLAEVAQRWADQCTFQHDSCRNDPRFKVGQNIYWSSGFSSVNWTRAIDMWYNEVSRFNRRGVRSFYDDSSIGHYTQMVWGNTRLIGCGRTTYGGEYRRQGYRPREFVLSASPSTPLINDTTADQLTHKRDSRYSNVGFFGGATFDPAGAQGAITGTSSGSRPNYPGTGNRPNYPGTGNRPNYPGTGNRPNYPGTGNRPNYPGTGNRPNYPGTGNRPNYPGTGNRPNYPGTGNRPNYPGTGSRPNYPGTGNRPNYPGTGNRPNYPGTGNLPNYPGTGNRPNYPGTGNRPNYPGTGNRPNYPGTGNRPNFPGTGNFPSFPGTENRPNYPYTENFPSFPSTGNRPNYPGTGTWSGLGNLPFVGGLGNNPNRPSNEAFPGFGNIFNRPTNAINWPIYGTQANIGQSYGYYPGSYGYYPVGPNQYPLYTDANADLGFFEGHHESPTEPMIMKPQEGNLPTYDEWQQTQGNDAGWSNGEWQSTNYDYVGGDQILICNYGPSANYFDQPVYIEGKACSRCPTGATCEDGLCMTR